MEAKADEDLSKVEIPVETTVDALKPKKELLEAVPEHKSPAAASDSQKQGNDDGAESKVEETKSTKHPATAATTKGDLLDETAIESDKVKLKTDTAHSGPEDEDAVEDKFEDAVDSEEKLETTEISFTTAKESSRSGPESIPSGTSLPSATPDSPETLVPEPTTKAESYEIDSSSDKSTPVKNTPAPGYTSRPGPSSSKVAPVARSLPVKASSEIVTVDLDDDDDDEDDEDEERAVRNARSKREAYDIDEDYEDDDDYYDDPDSDDQDVSRVIHEAVDGINAIDDPDSADDKMDVSSDEDGYSEDDDDQHRHLSRLDGSSAKRKRRDYSEDEVVYGDDEDVDFVEDDGDDDDDEDDEDVEEVVDLDEEKVLKKPVSVGQISVDDESDDGVQQVKHSMHKVKYKTYRKKLVANIVKKTHKILNRRSMHVMEEGGDVLVCSDAKIVSLKSAIGAVVKPSSAEEASNIGKDPDIKEDRTKEQTASAETQDKPKALIEDTESAATAVGNDSHRNEENKENMTIKDTTKGARRETTEEKVKPNDDERCERRGRKPAKEESDAIDSVMDDIDDIIDETKYQNGSKGEFNDELTFQMDVDGSQPDDEDHYEEDDDDDEDDEEGAVDLSSSYDANKSDREDYGRQSQTDESDAVEMIESSPEKSSNAPSVSKSPKKPPVPKLESDLSNTIKQGSESSVSVKDDRVHDVEKQQELDEKVASVACKASPKKKDEQADNLIEAEPVSRKRRRSVEPDEEREVEPLVPSKKLKRELECNFQAHDLLLKEYIETTTKNSVDDVQKHTDALQVEIRTLNEMIRAKENEWNNMIHLKKVKEEILLRLTRKKHVLNLTDTKLGEESEFSNFDSTNLTNVRSASVGPRPPTPPPEVDVRPASVTPVHSNALNSGSRNATSSNHSIPSGRQHLSLPSSKDNSLFAQFNHSNSSVTMVPLSTSPALITSTNTILQSRANMKSAEVARERSNAVQIQRQILPKPVLSNHQQILNNLAMSAGLTAAAITSASGSTSISNTAPTATNAANAAAAAIAANNILAGLSAQAAALLNGHHSPSGSNHHQQSGNQLQVGRQGVIKDVKSIIADYRQKHPEQVPRRGRRLKNIPNYDGGKGIPGSAASRMTELSFLLAAAEQQQSQQNAAANLSKGAYPEVTLHPVMNSNSTSASISNAEMNHSAGNHTNGANQSQNNNSNSSTNSLLHGILTKTSSRPNATGFTSFSPTLARLLTAPERMSSQAATVTSGALANLQANTGLNLSKSNSEITITPVVASNLQQSLLAHQQQLQEQQKQLQRLREQHFLNMDDEADDSVDRLVIDEGDDHHGSSSAARADGQHHREREPSVVITTRGGNGPEFENDVPECQGCKKREAQFVCAGCGNQWYCSRECQVNAWDDHSEVCTG